tara:strand:- start:56 stop:715 length:660 start_codon:yes stop_codon:yes gene_type:complete
MHFRTKSSQADLARDYIFNIPASADQDILKTMMEEQLDGVNQVTVAYGDSDDREYSMGRRACSSIGNVVTISFDDVDETFVGDDGDIPPLQLDMLNSPVNPRTYLEEGDGTFLMARLSGNTASVTPTAVEVNKGIKYEDRSAPYESGSGTDTLTFKYTVQIGDSSADLEATRLLVASGSIYRAPAGYTSLNSTVLATSSWFSKLEMYSNTWNFPTKTSR